VPMSPKTTPRAEPQDSSEGDRGFHRALNVRTSGSLRPRNLPDKKKRKLFSLNTPENKFASPTECKLWQLSFLEQWSSARPGLHG
jgi:hypothetical protein